MSSRTLHALGGCSSGGWREDDCLLVDRCAVPLKEAVAGDCHPNIVLFHGAAPLPEIFDFALVMERVQGGTLDVLAVPPPHGLDCRHCCKIILDFCCALVYLRSMALQLVHGTPKIPMPLLRPHGFGAARSCC